MIKPISWVITVLMKCFSNLSPSYISDTCGSNTRKIRNKNINRHRNINNREICLYTFIFFRQFLTL